MKDVYYNRYLKGILSEDLKTKMVFIGGPRQVGKTKFSLHFLKNCGEFHPVYLNWDDPGVPQSIFKGEIPPNQKLIILDEIHKFSHLHN